MLQSQCSISKVSDGLPQLRNEFAQVHFPNINNRFAKNEKELKLIFVINHLWQFKFKEIFYKIKKAFAFGKRHDKYNTKYKIVKDLVQEAKKFKKALLRI